MRVNKSLWGPEEMWKTKEKHEEDRLYEWKNERKTENSILEPNGFLMGYQWIHIVTHMLYICRIWIAHVQTKSYMYSIYMQSADTNIGMIVQFPLWTITIESMPKYHFYYDIISSNMKLNA